MEGAINIIKVFSATIARERESLGERVTRWLQANPGVIVTKAVVRLSSDSAYHCLSIVLLGEQQGA